MMTRPVFRADPVLPVQAMQTYSIRVPQATHWRSASCEEVECSAYLKGWKTILPGNSDLIYLLKRSGRRYTEQRVDAGLIEFTFAAGQSCFKASQHKVRIARPEIYVVRGGDWRGSTGIIRRHTQPEHWVEDMQERLDGIRNQ